MKILVVGGGGREHALCWSLAASPDCSALYCAPGNAGIAEDATCVDIGAEDIDALVAFAKEKAINLVVVGPEAPLVLGLVDRLQAEGILAFGPSQAAARLEGSKGFMKDICAKYGIPTAAYQRFTDPADAKAFAAKLGAPVVVKADGLAAGKGVTVAMSLEEANEAIEDALVGGRFGAAGHEVIVEEFLEGEEVSLFGLCDGKKALVLPSAQDHKRVHDGDLGPNTGGMGAYSPAPIFTAEIAARACEETIDRLLSAMAAEGCPFVGILFAGLMITPAGEVKLIEYNVRFGDPECQVLLSRLDSDLLPVLTAAAQGDLGNQTLTFSQDKALVVVLAAEGYPGSYAKNTVIEDLAEASAADNLTIFHAGTGRSEQGDLISTGGRVLGVTAMGASVAQAQQRAYDAIDKISWPQGFCRRDIGWRAVAREEA
ncbi:phosphoribosylamine--glycine ligase [Rhodovibrionaceae bacterium A322]